MNEHPGPHPSDLLEIARRAMLHYGLEPDLPTDAAQQLAAIDTPAQSESEPLVDQRGLLWASIDNDDSRDLDQLSVSESAPGDAVRIRVAIADVDAIVRKGSALDRHAERNTTSVYTAAGVFPMLPERLSTDLTSLNEGQNRAAVVVEMVVADDGVISESTVYRAFVHNQAKLAYRSVAAWIEAGAEVPPAVARVPGMEEQIRVQDAVAQRLKRRRHDHGALVLETLESRPVVSDGAIVDFVPERKSRSRELIEDFMIAANGVVARFLRDQQFPSLRRVVRSPERWDRIEKVARDLGEQLPPDPDSAALAAFLERRRAADPNSFADLSLTIVKLIGSGEYVAERAGQDPGGHFGLAVRDYAHSTAPNRRFPDLITQRLVKAALNQQSPPYADAELDLLAQRCTEREDDAKKVERQVAKSAAALLLSSRIGEEFSAVVTGASPKGTWVRITHPTVEGKLVKGESGLDVGDRVRVRLVETDVERGFIDFARAAS